MAIYPPPTESLPIFDSSVFINALVASSTTSSTTATSTERLVMKQLGGFSSGNTDSLVEAIQEQNV